MQTRLTDEQVLAIIKRLQTGQYTSEEESSADLIRIQQIYHGVSDLIFWDRRNLTAEQILEEAKKQKPIILGPGPDQK